MNRLKHIAHKQTAAQEPEAGFMLVFVVLLVALVLIALAVAAPVVARDLQRDKEVEAQHRANEYVRAIRLYYRKFKTYPPSMDALANTNNVRCLRRQYIDPLTGKNDWRIIHVGENKTTVKGFFGEPLGGLNTSGAGGGLGGTSTPSTTVNSSSPLSAGFQGATIGGSSGSTTGSSTAGGNVGQIMGVGTSKTGTSILNPNGQTTYETWEFLYDPKIELLYSQANLFGGGTKSGLNSTSPGSLGSSGASGQSNTNGTGTGTTQPPAGPPGRQ